MPDHRAAWLGLDEQQRAAVRLLCAGLTDDEIATRLQIPREAVQLLLRSAGSRLDARSRPELALAAAAARSAETRSCS